MKKSTLLSLATAGAIVVTSAGTFAAWDKLTDTNTTTVTLRNPVTVTKGTFNELTTVSEYDVLPEYASSASFTVAEAPTGYKFEATGKIKSGDTDVTEHFTVVVGDTTATDINGIHTVDVTVKPKDTTAAKALAGSALDVEVTGQLVKSTN